MLCNPENLILCRPEQSGRWRLGNFHSHLKLVHKINFSNPSPEIEESENSGHDTQVSYTESTNAASDTNEMVIDSLEEERLSDVSRFQYLIILISAINFHFFFQ